MFRWGFSNGKSVDQTEKDAKRLFARELWNKLHLQIIFYGREYSPARGWDLKRITSQVELAEVKLKSGKRSKAQGKESLTEESSPIVVIFGLH